RYKSNLVVYSVSIATVAQVAQVCKVLRPENRVVLWGGFRTEEHGGATALVSWSSEDTSHYALCFNFTTASDECSTSTGIGVPQRLHNFRPGTKLRRHAARLEPTEYWRTTHDYGCMQAPPPRPHTHTHEPQRHPAGSAGSSLGRRSTTLAQQPPPNTGNCGLQPFLFYLNSVRGAL
ncbi:unnamed protein product, partial [Ixodes pacificus]